MPNAHAVERSFAEALPALDNVRAECDLTSCLVTAQPRNAVEANQQTLERLMTNDIPSFMTGSAYTLAEPVQIEEVGPDLNILRIRVSMKPER